MHGIVNCHIDYQHCAAVRLPTVPLPWQEFQEFSELILEAIVDILKSFQSIFVQVQSIPISK